jgi:hypothetical protein
MFEMLTGRMPFHGETVPEISAAVMFKEPDWAARPSKPSCGIAKSVAEVPHQRAAQPRSRILDVRIAIDELLNGS